MKFTAATKSKAPDALDLILELRGQIARLKQEHDELSNDEHGLVSLAETRSGIDRSMEALRERGREELFSRAGDIRKPGAQPSAEQAEEFIRGRWFSAPGVHQISAAVLAVCCFEVLREIWIEGAESLGEGMAQQPRTARRLEIGAQLDNLETQEEDAIRALEARGLPYDRRSDARAEVVLKYNPDTGDYDRELERRIMGDDETPGGELKARYDAEETARRSRDVKRTAVQRMEERIAQRRENHPRAYNPEADLAELDRARNALVLAQNELKLAHERHSQIIGLASRIRAAVEKWALEQTAKRPRRDNPNAVAPEVVLAPKESNVVRSNYSAESPIDEHARHQRGELM